MTKCWVPGCERDGRGTYFCATHWLLVKPEERAALKMAYASPFHPRDEFAMGEDGLHGLGLEYLEVRGVVREVAAALPRREPWHERQRRRAA